jgi:TetR/AcrR family transcriptional regulator, regulator of cefoperazone and chloramphenicol sensitivity
MEMKETPVVTRERILAEAESLFAEKGYEAVSIREITGAAGCNLAAVNYHFGTKQNLYLEVFRECWVPRARRIHQAFYQALDAQDDPTPDAVIEALARAFLEGPLSEEERARHHQLVAREMAKPTEAFDLLAREMMVPFVSEVAQLLRKADPERPLEEEDLLLAILSLLASVLYFNFARTAVTRITGRSYDQAFRSRLIRHITRHATGGMRAGEPGTGRRRA